MVRHDLHPSPVITYPHMSSSRNGHSSRNSMSPPLLILYDARSHSPSAAPWAPNIWRVRFMLNFKRLPYRTCWLELHDVERELTRIGAPPSAVRSDGSPVYTLPVLVDPIRNPTKPKILSSPNKIADYLEAAYPARPIFPEGSRAMQAMFVHYIQEVFSKPLLPIMVPMTHHRLPDQTQAHFRGGQPAGTLIGPQREQAWLAVQEQFNFLAKIMDKNNVDGDGVVSMGTEVSYADFAIVSILIWIEQMAAHDGWARVRTWNGGRWNRLWDRCREYMDVR